MTARRPTSIYDDVTEADFQVQLIDCLHLHGWFVSHFRTSMTRSGNYATAVQADGAGWPDLFAVHLKAGDVLAAELKSERGRATALQLQWLALLEACKIDAYLWRPSQIDEAIERIARPRRRLRSSVP